MRYMTNLDARPYNDPIHIAAALEEVVADYRKMFLPTPAFQHWQPPDTLHLKYCGSVCICFAKAA